HAVEAAAIVGGEDAFWAMHDRMMAANAPIDDAWLGNAAAALGLDSAAFSEALASSEAGAAVADDVAIGKRIGVRSIPTIFVNGRRVPRWLRSGEPILGEIVAEASGAVAD
ncbi:MAG: hypothetical protein D6744_05565, partial [Planctomycetota bacterium]